MQENKEEKRKERKKERKKRKEEGGRKEGMAGWPGAGQAAALAAKAGRRPGPVAMGDSPYPWQK